jgi:hypothetical protein
MQHPSRDPERRFIRELTTREFAIRMYFAEAGRQRLTDQWMPMIIDRDRLKNRGTM